MSLHYGIKETQLHDLHIAAIHNNLSTIFYLVPILNIFTKLFLAKKYAMFPLSEIVKGPKTWSRLFIDFMFKIIQ